VRAAVVPSMRCLRDRPMLLIWLSGEGRAEVWAPQFIWSLVSRGVCNEIGEGSGEGQCYGSEVRECSVNKSLQVADVALQAGVMAR
jgi:hypothetical protein